MAKLEAYVGCKHFNVTWPSEYVAHVEINRPEKLNAFFEDMWLEFGGLFNELSRDPRVRCIVLSGAGERAFTSGLDVQAASQSSVLRGGESGDSARRATELRRYISGFQECISAMEKCEKPVVCVTHGISWGLAIDIACCADIRVCAKDTSFAVKEVDIGMAADMGTLSRLPKAVGSQSWVKDVCLSARTFSAAEALSVGFVTQIHDTKAQAVGAAQRLAALMASKSPVAVQGTKELLNHARDHSVADSLRYTGIWNSAALQSKDLQAAVMSGLTKKTPRFEKL